MVSVAGSDLTLYRHCHPEQTDLAATLQASQIWGGRFNPRSEFGAIYAAYERDTAVRELIRFAKGVGTPLVDLDPRAMLTISVRLHRILDLTDDMIRTEWGITADATEDISWEVCQEIGRTARRAGYEAVAYGSAASGGTAVAIFADRLHPGSYVTTAATALFSPFAEEL